MLLSCLLGGYGSRTRTKNQRNSEKDVSLIPARLLRHGSVKPKPSQPRLQPV